MRFKLFAEDFGGELAGFAFVEHGKLRVEAEFVKLFAHELEAKAVERADVRGWLDRAARLRERYDLIVLDPPSFSNSKKMAGVLDVQRDHVALIDSCLGLLAPGGELFFSTNLRSFELDAGLARDARFSDITQRTIPEDFRDTRIHRAWLVRA